MSLSLLCTCGAQFEVEETFAGQLVACPECQGAVQAPLASSQPVRTSGYAIASVISGLVLAFTGTGFLAVLFGIAALVSIARNRGKVKGAGFAIFGMVAGVSFSILFYLAVIPTELFGLGDMVRTGRYAGQVTRGGPVVIERDGFSIARPSDQWGVAKPELQDELEPYADPVVTLVNPHLDAHIAVSKEELMWRSLDDYRTDLIEEYEDISRGFGGGRHRMTMRHSKSLPDRDGNRIYELFFDLQDGRKKLTYIVWFVTPRRSNDLFIIRCKGLKNLFPDTEPDIREALRRFRVEE